MGTPWTYGPVEFTIDTDETPVAVLELKVIHRGRLKSMRLNQLTGVAGAGSFRIFTKRAAAEAVAGNSASSALAGVDPDAYSLFGEKTIAGGKFEDFDMSYDFVNKDGTPSMPVRRLWMVIEPGPTGEVTYSLSMTFEGSELL